MVGRTALYIEAVLCILGMRSFVHACGTLFVAGLGYIVLNKEVTKMQTFFVPDSPNALVFIVLIGLVAGIIISVGINSMRKTESKGAGQPWKGRFIATTALMAIAAPVLAWLLVGLFAQTWFADVTIELYILLIVLATIPLTKWGFTLINDGPQAMINEIVGHIGVAKDGAEKIRRKMNE